MAITLVQKNKSKGILTWYARVPDKDKGTTHFFSLGTSAKNEAKIVLQQKIRNGDFDTRISSSNMTLGEAVEKYEIYQRSKGLKEGSIAMFLNSIRSIETLFNRQIASLTNAEISEAFLERNKNVNPTTYHNNKTVVSMLFRYIINVLEVIDTNPILKAIPNRKRVKAVRHFWTTEEIDLIIAHAPNPDTRLVWSFMAFAGLRRTEAMNLKPSDIHDGYIFVVGKGNKPAKIPLCPRLQREIDRHGGTWGHLYVNNKVLAKYAKIALPGGFQGTAHAHRFRHSFGSNLIRAGVNVKVVQKLMRHENIKMTLDIYGHILDTDAEDAICKVYT